MKTLAPLLIAASLACACGKKDDKSADDPAESAVKAPSDVTPDADIDMPDPARLEAYMRATMTAVDSAGGDCAKLAAPVVRLARDNAELLARMAATNHTNQAKRWKSDNPELYGDFTTAMRAIARCARQDPALVELLQSLSPKPPPRAPLPGKP